MNDITIIAVNEDNRTISARELHRSLNILTRFNDWFPRVCEYGFVEGIDYFYSNLSNSIDRPKNRPRTDYLLTLDMAKQICMLQRTPEGKRCRQYLIELEKAWNSPEQVMARALKIADDSIKSLRSQNNQLTEDIARMKPKEVFADAVSASDSSILIGELAKILKQNGVEMGEKRFYEWLRSNGYLISRKGTDWNAPTQRSMEMKLFEIKERTINNGTGGPHIVKTTVVTGKGQQYFINKLLEAGKECGAGKTEAVQG